MTPNKIISLLAVLLTVSLCANAFQFGFVVSRPPMPPPPHMEGGPGSPDAAPGDRMKAAMRQFVEKLPKEARGPLMERMRDQREALVGGMRAMHESRQGVASSITAEPFDKEELKKQLAALRQAQADVQQKVHDSLAEGIAELSPEARQELGKNAGKLFR